MHYSDPILAKYITLLQTSQPDIKVYYQGEPVRVPSSSLPCAIVSKHATRVTPLNNQADQHSIVLSITVIADIRSDLSTEENIAKITAGVSSLYNIVEGRKADYTLKDTSILQILRHNNSLDTANNLRTDLGSVTEVDYGMTLRDRAPEQWSIEARISFIATFQQTR